MRAAAEVVDPKKQPSNLVDLLLARAEEPSRVATGFKKAGVWQEMTWQQVLEEVTKVSNGLVAIGVKPGDRVAIFAATGLNWVVCDMAIAAAQAITVPIYASNTPDEARYIVSHSESVYLFVDNDEAEGAQKGRVTRIREKLGECPAVKKVFLFEGQPKSPKEGTLADLAKQGEAVTKSSPDALKERAKKIKPDDPVCFIYTSGTTGDPKGVILTHGNWTYEAVSTGKLNLTNSADATMLFLPLAHSFAQVIKASWLETGSKLIFAESIDKLVANLAETRPTVLPAVPRVFEKVYNGVVANGSSAPGVKGKLFRWAFKLFDEYVDARIAGREYSSLGFVLAKKLVFAKVQVALKEKLGGRVRIFLSGGAPLSRKIAYFFELLGFEVLEGYGLTETSAATTVNLPGAAKIGTVGPAIPGTEVRIASDGEIMIRGPGVMKGYYKNPEATAEVLEKDGWFHSGDIGEIDSQGYVKITDRKKDIIVTAGGKNVAPQNIENQLKTYPLVSQAMVYGDKRKYLSCLVCVAEEPARKLLQDKGITVGAYGELAKRSEIATAVQKVIDEVNATMPPYQTLKKFQLMERDFSQENGELTPTLKVKRKFCSAKYKALLDKMYDEGVVD